MTWASPACSGRRRPSGTSSGSDHGPAHTTATSASMRRRRVKARTPSPCGASAMHFSRSCTTAPAAHGEAHLQQRSSGARGSPRRRAGRSPARRAAGASPGTSARRRGGRARRSATPASRSAAAIGGTTEPRCSRPLRRSSVSPPRRSRSFQSSSARTARRTSSASECESRNERVSWPEPPRSWPIACCSISDTPQPRSASTRAAAAPIAPAPTTTAVRRSLTSPSWPRSAATASSRSACTASAT